MWQILNRFRGFKSESRSCGSKKGSFGVKDQELNGLKEGIKIQNSFMHPLFREEAKFVSKEFKERMGSGLRETITFLAYFTSLSGRLCF